MLAQNGHAYERGAEKAKTAFSPIDAQRTTKTEAAADKILADIIVEMKATTDGEDQSLEAEEAATSETRHKKIAEANKCGNCLHDVGRVFKSCPDASTNLDAAASGTGEAKLIATGEAGV